MKKKNLYCLAVAFLLVQSMFAAQPFRTGIFSDKIKTLRVSVVDDWQAPPVIQLEGGTAIEVSFDELSPQSKAYTYTLTHCNADWTPSQLIQSEFMSGFQHSYINDYSTSFNTTMDYTNYKIFFPNEDLTMKVSGNYVARVYPENDKEHPVLTACFSVVEQEIPIQIRVDSRTDKGVNTYYQQVAFELTCGNQVTTPMQDLKVYVFQNNRTDNQAALVRPMSVYGKRLVYNHNPALIFEGGNEYRSFEMITPKSNGLGIEAVEFHAPYFHTILRPSGIRSGYSYAYTEDIDGKFFIRNKDAVEYDYEADYNFVHFYLPCEKPFSENVYLLGEAFQNIMDERSRMEYSEADKGYVKTVLLKEGYYNYLYVTKKSGDSPGNTAPIEGNYFQTENEYRVMVYHRPMGARYDRLAGMQVIQFK